MSTVTKPNESIIIITIPKTMCTQKQTKKVIHRVISTDEQTRKKK